MTLEERLTREITGQVLFDRFSRGRYATDASFYQIMPVGVVARDDAGSDLFRDMLALGKREAAEISEKFPKVQRRVGGYNLDALVPRNAPNNMAHLLVGSEGTLAFTTQVELKLWPVIRNKVLGVCHFGSFYEAMDASQHLVRLRPIAV